MRVTSGHFSAGGRQPRPILQSARRKDEKFSKVAELAKHTMEQSRKAIQALRPCASDPSIKLKQRLWEQIQLAQTILSQTEQKLQGQKSIPERIDSFNDSEAQPIRKGKLNQAVEFGRTLQLVQDSSGVVLHYGFTGAIPATERNCFGCCVRQKQSRHKAQETPCGSRLLQYRGCSAA